MIRSQLTYDFTHDHRIKLLVCGECSVGKTSLLTRFVSDKFNVSQNRTVGVDIMIKNVVVQEKKIQLKLWDTAGMKGIDSVNKVHFRKVHGILLVYDVTDRKTFDNLTKWMHNLKKVVSHSKVPIVLLGNKVDLEAQRKVDTSEAVEFAAKHDLQFFETSCLTSLNVTEVFHGIMEKILEECDSLDSSMEQTDSEPVSLLEESGHKRKCCCR